MKEVRNWSRVALIYFVIAAFAGLLMRYLPTSFLAGINYKYLLHTHSHVALLGWAYLAGIIAILNSYSSNSSRLGVKQYRNVLWFTNITVMGMMFSFPFQGYAAVSITFSTLFLFASYWFVYQFLSKRERTYKNTSDRFIKSGLIYLVISSIGPWALGPIIAMGYSHGDWYYLAIYFYLHFLYNGFFVMIVLGLFYKILEKKSQGNSVAGAKKVFFYTNLTIAPASLLSALWLRPNVIIYVIAGAAAVLQGVAVLYLIPDIKKFLTGKFNSWLKLVFGISFLSYTIKVVLQLVSSMPAIADFIYATSNYTAIAYLHLVLLGFVSVFLVGYFAFQAIYGLNRLAIVGIVLFFIGLIASEALLFTQGMITYYWSIAIPDFHNILFYASALMPCGILFFMVGQFIPEIRSDVIKG